MRTGLAVYFLGCGQRLVDFDSPLQGDSREAERWLHFRQKIGQIGEDAHTRMSHESGDVYCFGTFENGMGDEWRRQTLPNGKVIIDVRAHGHGLAPVSKRRSAGYGAGSIRSVRNI